MKLLATTALSLSAFLGLFWLQITDGPIYLPTIFSAPAESSTEALMDGYVQSCDTTHQYTEVQLSNVYGTYAQLAYSSSRDGAPIATTSQRFLRISPTGPVAGNWWAWLLDAEGNRISESVPFETHGTPGLGNCQIVRLVFFEEDGSADPCADSSGGDGCKWRITNGPGFATAQTTTLTLQLLFIDSSVDGGQAQGSYYIALEKDGTLLPISDQVRSVALVKNAGPLGQYNYEYELPIADIPDQQAAGQYTGWVLDGNGVRDSQIFTLTIPENASRLWIEFDQAQSPVSTYFNVAVVARCDPNATVTYVQGKTYVEGSPRSGDWFVGYSNTAGGPLIAKVKAGPHAGYEGWAQGFYSHILQGDGPREGDWYFWVVDSTDRRISEIANVRTDGEAGPGACQQAEIDFDSR